MPASCPTACAGGGAGKVKQGLQFALSIYKRWISPMLPHSCRFVPTCSEYAMDAIDRYGAARGSMLSVGRLLRCHPFARPGLDLVPQRKQTVRPAPLTSRSVHGRGSEESLYLLDGK